MSDKLRLIATTAALLVSGWIGHGIGSSDRQAAEHRAARLETLMRDSEARHRQAQIALAEELRSREAAFEVRLRELQVSFDEQKVEMIEALDDSQAQLADLAQRRRDTDAELLRVRKALASAGGGSSGRLRDELRERELQLVLLQGQLRQNAAGMSCLSAPVPPEALRTLNRVAGNGSRAR